jgi:hypothetical protein
MSYPRLDLYSDTNHEPETDEHLDVVAAQRFADLHGIEGDGSVYLSERNSALLRGWLFSRGARISVRNLEIAARELAGQLEKRAEPEPEPVSQIDRGIKSFRNTTVVRVGGNVSRQDIEVYADKPYESDVARKKRDEALRRAATADRIARRTTRR